MFTGTTDATSLTTGVLQIAGGSSITKNLWVGKKVTFDPAGSTGTTGLDFGSGEVIYRNGAGGLKIDGANILINGDVKPVTTATSDLGSSGLKWRQLFVSGTSTLGLITPSAITGAATSTTRSAGQVGERLSSVVATGSAVSLTTATTKTITSITLTPGNWSVYGKVNFNQTSVTGTDYKFGQHTTTDALGTDPTYGQLPFITTTLTAVTKQNIPRQDYSIAVSTTQVVYLVAQSTFAAGSVSAFGEIYAQRTD